MSRARANVTAPQPPLAIRVPALASMLSLGLSRTKELVAAGEIRSIKIGSTRLVPIKEVEKFLERNTK